MLILDGLRSWLHLWEWDLGKAVPGLGVEPQHVHIQGRSSHLEEELQAICYKKPSQLFCQVHPSSGKRNTRTKPERMDLYTTNLV